LKTRNRADTESGCYLSISQADANTCRAAAGEASDAPLVVISILNWNGWQDTIECLESVRRLDYSNFLTVVVDNGSSNGSADKIKAWAEENLGPDHVFADYSRETALAGGNPETEQALDLAASPARFVLIRNEENLGFTGGNNVAIHYALSRSIDTEYVFLLNNDALVDPQCVSSLVFVSHKAEAGIVGAMPVDREDRQAGSEAEISFVPCFFNPLTTPTITHRGNDEFWRSECVLGAGMLVRRDVLEAFYDARAEYLAAQLFMYWDDTVFCYMAKKLNYVTVFARDANIYHASGKSSGGHYSPLLFYYKERNKILVAKMTLPFWLKVLFHIVNPALALGRVIKYLRLRPDIARAVYEGFMDGHRGVGGKWRWHDREFFTFHSGARKDLAAGYTKPGVERP
jgi:GT2 family glycosyltransferase